MSDRDTMPNLEPVFRHPEDAADYAREKYEITYNSRKALTIVVCLMVSLLIFFLVVAWTF